LQASSQPSRQASSRPSSSSQPSSGPVCSASSFDYVSATSTEDAHYAVGDVVTEHDYQTGFWFNYECISDSLCDQRAVEVDANYGYCTGLSSYAYDAPYNLGDLVTSFYYDYSRPGVQHKYECISDSLCATPNYSHELSPTYGEQSWETREAWAWLGSCSVSFSRIFDLG